jgi:hypothetical protein
MYQKLYNDQRNAQVFNLFIHLLLSHVFWAFFKLIFRGKCTNSAVILAPGRWHHAQENRTTVEFVHLPRQMGLKKARNM